MWTYLMLGAAAVAGGVGATSFVRSRSRWQRVKADAAAGENQLTTTSAASQTFDPTVLDALPAPAQRWLGRIGGPGATLPSTVRFRIAGSTQYGPEAPHHPLSATAVIAPREGFVWRERDVGRALPHVGVLSFVDQHGVIEWSLRDTVHVVLEKVKESDDRNDDDRCMAGRYVSLLVLTPWAFLPADDVVWEAIDERRARVILHFDVETVPMEIEVDEAGRLVRASVRRWGAKTKDRHFEYFDFRVEVHDEHEVDGLTMPRKVTSYWAYDDDRPSPLLFHHEVEAVELG